MTTPNFYDLHGHSTRIGWYPNGKGGPIVAEGPPPKAPVLIYSAGASQVVAWGADLTIGEPTPAGRLVVAVVNKSGIVPGAIVAVSVLVPDVVIDSAPVPVHTMGVLSHHRGTAQLGAGQLETYTRLDLKGTAANVILPL
jgi:hypothetical protein